MTERTYTILSYGSSLLLLVSRTYSHLTLQILVHRKLQAARLRLPSRRLPFHWADGGRQALRSCHYARVCDGNASIASALNVMMEEVHEIKQRPLVAPCELSIRAIDHLQAILLVVRTKLVVIPKNHCQPRSRSELSTAVRHTYCRDQAKAPTTLTPSSYMLLSISRRKDW
jgi:hypothetical protein